MYGTTILMLCEPGVYGNLAQGFTVNAQVILERKQLNNIEKMLGHKDYRIVHWQDVFKSAKAIFHEEFENILFPASFTVFADNNFKEFTHVMIVESSSEITTLRTSDLEGETPITDWYYKRRGHFASKKFGL